MDEKILQGINESLKKIANIMERASGTDDLEKFLEDYEKFYKEYNAWRQKHLAGGIKPRDTNIDDDPPPPPPPPGHPS